MTQLITKRITITNDGMMISKKKVFIVFIALHYHFLPERLDCSLILDSAVVSSCFPMFASDVSENKKKILYEALLK